MGSLLLGIPAAGRAVQGCGAFTAAVPGFPRCPDVGHLLRTPCALGPAPPTPSLASCRSCAFSTEQDFQGLHECLPSLARYSFAFFQSRSYFATFCCSSNFLLSHCIFSCWKCWNSLMLNPLSFPRCQLPPCQWMSCLHSAHTVASFPLREESGMLNTDLPSIFHSSTQR